MSKLKFIATIVFFTVSCTDPQKLAVNERELASGDDSTTIVEAEAKSPSTDWSQPPLLCIEDMVPQAPKGQCPDFLSVNDPLNDWPQGMSEVDIEKWKKQKRPLSYCRNKALLDKEAATPGSFSKGKVENAWMIAEASKNHVKKAAAVYASSRRHKIPAHVLAGALYQESLFSDLGIAEDGGNYSCGIGQTNLAEWCGWANVQSDVDKQKMGWPTGLACANLNISMVKPFYDIALTKLNGEPDYKLNKKHFKNIALKDIESSWPSGSQELQKNRFAAVQSFINTCSNINEGIDAKANELKKLFNGFVPQGFKNREQYKKGESFKLKCKEKGDETYYPLHTGWIMAVGSYNAGPKAVDAFAYYHDLNKNDLKDESKLEGIEPNSLPRSFYYSGKYSPTDDKIHFTNLNGSDSSWNWFKLCVLHRHVGRVIQHNLAPGSEALVENLETQYPCAKSKFDPSSGALVQSGVPPERQKTSGKKN